MSPTQSGGLTRRGLVARPISLRGANAFLEKHHRRTRGVAIAGKGHGRDLPEVISHTPFRANRAADQHVMLHR
jgi:hypothetical protein